MQKKKKIFSVKKKKARRALIVTLSFDCVCDRMEMHRFL